MPSWEQEGDAIPAFLSRMVCLCVDEGCVSSVLGKDALSQGLQAPQDMKVTASATVKEQSSQYLLAVDADYNLESAYGVSARGYEGVLKMGAKTVLTELATMLTNWRFFLAQLYAESNRRCMVGTGFDPVEMKIHCLFFCLESRMYVTWILFFVQIEQQQGSS